MLWLALVTSEFFAGTAVCYHILRNKVDLPVILGLAFPIGMALSSLVFFVASAFFSFSAFHLLLHTCAISITSLVSLQKIRMDSLKNLTTLGFALIAIAASLFLTPKMYPSDVSVHRAFQSDVAEEIALTNSFRRGANGGFVNMFKIRHPSCYKCVARSRWLTAVNSAMLMTGGAGLRMALLVPSLLMTASFLFLLQKLASHFVSSPFSCLFLFLFCGGLGFFTFFENGVRTNPDLDFVFNLGRSQTEWSHPLLHYIFAFRPSQLSLCLVIGTMIVLVNGVGKRELAFVGLTLGILPAVQHQVFLGQFVFVSVYFTLRIASKKRKLREMTLRVATFAVFFAIPGCFTLVHYWPRATNAKLVTRAAFWNSLSHSGVFFPMLTLWWRALGPFVVIVMFVSWFVLDKELRMLFIPACVIFVIGNVFQFQGYNRCQIILFYPFWMVPAVIVFVATFEKLAKKVRSEQLKGVVTGLGIVIFVLSTASGCLGYWRLRGRSVVVFDSDMERAAQWITANTPRKAVFISAISDFDTVAQLAGRVSYFQNARYAWLYGFVFPVDRNKEIEELLRHSDSDLLPKVKYVVNKEEEAQSHQLVTWGRGNWSKVFTCQTIVIFERN